MYFIWTIYLYFFYRLWFTDDFVCVCCFQSMIMLFVKDLVSSEEIQDVKNPTVRFRRRLRLKRHFGQVVRLFHHKRKYFDFGDNGLHWRRQKWDPPLRKLMQSEFPRDRWFPVLIISSTFFLLLFFFFLKFPWQREVIRVGTGWTVIPVDTMNLHWQKDNSNDIHLISLDRFRTCFSLTQKWIREQ